MHVGGHTKSIEKINKSSEATLGIITCSYTLNFELQDECHELDHLAWATNEARTVRLPVIKHS